VVRIELTELVDPGHTAIVTQECQVGVIGPEAGLAELASAAGQEAIPNLARLLPVARSAGVQVVHCLFQRRADGLGANHNARLFAGVRGLGVDLSPGSSGAALLPELGPDPTDVVLTRWHGVGPMGGTDLDPVLRNLGVTTIVATGVSVNIAIQSLVMDAVNAGYQVVLPRDAVAGVPADYADAVIDNTLSLLATVTTTDALVETWVGKG
jgi:nicotinamidase-related amidase